MSEKRTEAQSAGRAARERELESRRATEHAVLQLSGEVGYERAAVAAILERSGSSRARFYGTFGGKEQCYASAYGWVAEDLCERMLACCRGPGDWIAAMRHALAELDSFLAADPALAAGVIREVHVAGGPALVRRAQIVERLSRAIDGARAEAAPLGPAPPPSTSTFIVAAIEAGTIRCLTESRPAAEILDGALFLAVASYFGLGTARRVLRGEPPSG